MRAFFMSWRAPRSAVFPVFENIGVTTQQVPQWNLLVLGNAAVRKTDVMVGNPRDDSLQMNMQVVPEDQQLRVLETEVRAVPFGVDTRRTFDRFDAPGRQERERGGEVGWPGAVARG